MREPQGKSQLGCVCDSFDRFNHVDKSQTDCRVGGLNQTPSCREMPCLFVLFPSKMKRTTTKTTMAMIEQGSLHYTLQLVNGVVSILYVGVENASHVSTRCNMNFFQGALGNHRVSNASLSQALSSTCFLFFCLAGPQPPQILDKSGTSDECPYKILRMAAKSISHRTRSPRMIRFPSKHQQITVSPGFKVVRNGFRPSTVPWTPER